MTVIGGAGDLPHWPCRLADRIYLTAVHAAPAGDTCFDAPDPHRGDETAREPMPQAPDDQFPADFIVLDRQALTACAVAQVAATPHITHSRRFICVHREGAL